MPPWSRGTSSVGDVAATARASAPHVADHRSAVVWSWLRYRITSPFAGRLDLEGGDIALLAPGSGFSSPLRPDAGSSTEVVVRRRGRCRLGQVMGGGVGDMVRFSEFVYSSTCSCRARSRCALPRAGRSGRGRTCGSRRAAGRSGGSGCTPWVLNLGVRRCWTLRSLRHLVPLLVNFRSRLSSWRGVAPPSPQAAYPPPRRAAVGLGVRVGVLLLELLERCRSASARKRASSLDAPPPPQPHVLHSRDGPPGRRASRARQQLEGLLVGLG